jgi:prepilin-type N-terminal cleavage/methylation domain-containing protein
MDYQSKRVNFGFTMVELLVSMVILGVIFVAASQLLTDSMKGSQVVSAQTSLQEELRSAAGIMNDEIQRAYYVFPPQSSKIQTQSVTDITVDWSSFNLGTSNLKTGIHESTTFVVSDTTSSSNPPFLAMITAPRDPTQPCLTTTKTNPTSDDIYQDATTGNTGWGCYQFVAYYGVLRPKVTRGLVGNSTTSSELLDNDDANTGRMVLMEFRMNMIARITSTPSIDWGEVGCQSLLRAPAARCTTPATTSDPSDSIQVLNNSLPALSCLKRCDTSSKTSLPLLQSAQRFQQRIKDTVTWINANTGTVTPSILADYIDESVANGSEGFRVLMPTNTYDARGIFQVRLRLQGKINVGGVNTSFPAAPVTVYASPRNIAPLL